MVGFEHRGKDLQRRVEGMRGTGSVVQAVGDGVNLGFPYPGSQLSPDRSRGQRLASGPLLAVPRSSSATCGAAPKWDYPARHVQRVVVGPAKHRKSLF
jgi:hypothetical protein